MKNRLLLALIIIFSITTPALAIKVPNELKLGAVMFGKISIGVLISIVLIWIGLNLYKKILNKNKNFIPPQKTKSKKDSTTNNFTCEIDNVETIDDAINTFLTIDNRH